MAEDSGSDIEDWDDDFDVEITNKPKLSLPGIDAFNSEKKSIMTEVDDDDDWDSDFGDGQKIIGIAADPKNKEDFDDDFDFGDDDDIFSNTPGKPEPTAVKLTPQKQQGLQRTTSLSNFQDRVIGVLKDFVPHLPDPQKHSSSKDIKQDYISMDAPTKENLAEIKKKAKKYKDNEDKSKESLANWEVGKAYYGKKSLPNSIKYYQKALKLIQAERKNPERKEIESKILYCMGLTAKSAADIFQQKDYFQRALEIQQNTKQPVSLLVANINYELGLIQTQNLKPIPGLKCFEFFLKELLWNGKAPTSNLKGPFNWKQLATCYLNIAICGKQIDSILLWEPYCKAAIAAASVKNSEDEEIVKTANEMLDSIDLNESFDLKGDNGDDDFEDWGSEDWDVEFDLDPQDPKRLSFGMGDKADSWSPFSDGNNVEEQDIPSMYKLIDATMKKTQYNIVKFPNPTFLYSLQTKDGHSFMHEERLQQWLKNLLEKHSKYIDISDPPSYNELRNDFFHHLEKIDKFSKGWARLYVKFCFAMYRDKHFELCWDSIHSFFVDLKDNRFTGKYKSKQDKRDREAICSMALKLLYLAGKLWKHDENSVYKDMVQSLLQFEPRNSDVIKVLEYETYYHHKKDCSKQIANFVKLYRSLEAGKIPQGAEEPSHKRSYETGPTNSKARCLVDIYLTLNDYSPLTTQMENETSDDYEESDVDLDLDENEELFNFDVLVTKLKELYVSMNKSLTKAKAAYCLGHYFSTYKADTKTAEKLCFESVYIVDHILPSLKNLPLITSELGSNALKKYGEILILNSKYQYGILCFEATLANYNLRGQSSAKRHFALLRHIAATARDYGDMKRAVDYHHEILRKYREDNKTNEMIFVSEILSSMYLEQGDFRLAETFLKGAASLLPDPFEEVLSPQSFQIQLKIADVYLSSYNFERGIELLEKLNQGQLPKGKKNVVLSVLASAYIKKHWFKECSKILSHFEEENKKSGKTTVGRKTDNLEDNTILYYRLCASNFYQARKYKEALKAINEAIGICGGGYLSALGQLFYIRGKIFQALCSSSISVTFPTTLELDDEGPPDEVTYTCTGDLIQECAASFDKAYHYFRAIGDDIYISKCVSHIAELFLERLFCPVALLLYPYDDIATLPAFEVSKRVAKAKDESVSEKKKESFVISFARIENPCTLALDICAETANVGLMLKCYMNAAELMYLQGKKELALKYWTECKEHLYKLFFDGPNIIGKQMPPSFLDKLAHSLKRAVRFMFCFDNELIKKNVMLIDSYLLIQSQVVSAQKRSITPIVVEQDPNDIPFDSIIYDEKYADVSRTLGRSVKNPNTSSEENNGSSRPAVQNIFENQDVVVGQNSTQEIVEEEQLTTEVEIVAERIWGYKHCIKEELRKCASGKTERDIALNNNQNCIKKILKQNQVFRVANLPKNQPKQNIGKRKNLSQRDLHAGSNNSLLKEAYTFLDAEETVDTAPGLQKLTYVLHFDDYLIYCVPSTGTKRINRIGGKEESLKHDDGGNQVVCVQIKLMARAKESVTFMATPNLTLDKILGTICNKKYWKAEKHGHHYSTQSGSSGRSKPRFANWGSISRNNKSSLNELKFVEQTENFKEQLVNVISMLGSAGSRSSLGDIYESMESLEMDSTDISSSTEVSPSGSFDIAGKEKQRPDSLICFARKNQQEFLPLGDQMDSSISHIFSNHEMNECSEAKPLELYLYISSDSSTDQVTQGRSGSFRKRIEKSVLLSQAMLNYMSDLVLDSPKDPVPEEINISRQLTEEMATSVFSSLLEILPTSETEKLEGDVLDWNKKNRRSIPLFGTTKDDSLQLHPVTSCPILLICSKTLQIFPWEIILGDLVLRHFSLVDLLTKHKTDKIHHKEKELAYFSCHYSGGDVKYIAKAETNRKNLIVQENFYHLNMYDKLPSHQRYASSQFPLHSPLLKYGKKGVSQKKKYKYLKFLDLGSSQIFDPVAILDKVKPDYRSVLLCTYGDLLENNDALQRLIRLRPHCTVIFIPSGKMKHVVARFMKLQDLKAQQQRADEKHHTKSDDKLTNHYQFLMSTIFSLQRELSVPIVILNAPKCRPL